MIEAGKTYVVMGLLDPSSIAYAVGSTIESMGGRVVYTIQNEYIKTMVFNIDQPEALPLLQRIFG